MAGAVLLGAASRSVWSALLFLVVGGPLIYLRYRLALSNSQQMREPDEIAAALPDPVRCQAWGVRGRIVSGRCPWCHAPASAESA